MENHYHEMLKLVDGVKDIDLRAHIVNNFISVYGTGGVYSHEEISNVLGMTVEEVQKVEAKALQKLKHPKIHRSLKQFLGI